MSSVIKRAAVSFVVCVGMSSAAFAGWTSSSGGNVPEQSVVAGSESDGAPLFVCRANYNGGVHPGKVRKAFGGCILVGEVVNTRSLSMRYIPQP